MIDYLDFLLPLSLIALMILVASGAMVTRTTQHAEPESCAIEFAQALHRLDPDLQITLK